MILIDNFKKIDDWPTYGFLYGDNILDQELFDILADFDFDKVSITDPSFPDRKSITTSNSSNIDQELYIALASLQEWANDFSIIEPLIIRSFENSNMSINNFWTHGLTSIEQLQNNVFIQFVEDNPNLYMAPHADHREVLCNIQVYISPNVPEIGTSFFKAGDYTQFKTAQFTPNSGYFSVNTHESIHGVRNTSSQKRKSIIISWTM
jgi:hypothetical protein